MLALMKQCKIFRKMTVVQDLAPEQMPACWKHPLSAAARAGDRAQRVGHGPARTTEERKVKTIIAFGVDIGQEVCPFWDASTPV